MNIVTKFKQWFLGENPTRKALCSTEVVREFKTAYPTDYKPFTQWSNTDRLELYQQFKSIS